MLPLELFENLVSKNVIVHTTDGTKYTGTLVGFDIYVNTILKNAIFDDVEGNRSTVIKECIINGNSITYIENI